MRVGAASALAGGIVALVCCVALTITPRAQATTTDRPADQISAYVAELRQAAQLARRAAGATGSLGTSGRPNCARVGPAAASLSRAAEGAEAIFRRYQRARTRYGTREEIALMVGLTKDLVAARRNVAKAAGAGPPSQAEQQAAQREVSLFQAVIAKKVGDRLQIEGLSDVLRSTSFREVREKVAAEIRSRVQSRAEAELRRLVGFQVKLDVPLKTQIKDFLTAELSHVLSKLVVAAGPAGIVIRLVAGRILNPGKIVEIVGAKLKEALRQKGRLEPRTRTSLAGLERLRISLNAPASTPVSKIVAAERKARRELGKTRFLEGDLARAGKTDLLAKLTKAKRDLERAIRVARFRFLLDSDIFGFDFREDVAHARRAAAEAAGLAKKLGCEDSTPPSPAGSACKENWWTGTWDRLEHGGQTIFRQNGKRMTSGEHTWFGGGKITDMKLSADCLTMTAKIPKTKQQPKASEFEITLDGKDAFGGNWRWATTPKDTWNGTYTSRRAP